MGANGTHWGEPFLAELERDFELILYDHRGIGRSAPLQGGGVTVPGLAADALALLDALGIEARTCSASRWAGWSPRSSRSPRRERRAHADPRRHVLRRHAVARDGARGRPAPDDGRPLARPRAHAAHGLRARRLAPARRRARALRRVRGGRASSFRRACRSCSPRRAPPTRTTRTRACAALRVPTLVIHGTADELLASINGDLVASLIPGARLELLEGVGHLFFWEQPQRSAELVRRVRARTPGYCPAHDAYRGTRARADDRLLVRGHDEVPRSRLAGRRRAGLQGAWSARCRCCRPTARRSAARSSVRTSFGGPGARDGFEAVTRALTGDRYTVDAVARAPRARPRARALRLRRSPTAIARSRSCVRDGIIDPEFIDLVAHREPHRGAEASASRC